MLQRCNIAGQNCHEILVVNYDQVAHTRSIGQSWCNVKQIVAAPFVASCSLTPAQVDSKRDGSIDPDELLQLDPCTG